MKNSLSTYEFEKLAALIEIFCLLVLIVLYAIFIRVNLFSTFVIGVIIAIVIGFVMTFFWFSKAERTVLESGVRLWNAKRMVIYLFFPFACTFVGLVTTVIYLKDDIARLMIVILSCYLGFNLGGIAKVKYRYRKT